MIDLSVRLEMRDFKKWGGILIMGVREGVGDFEMGVVDTPLRTMT